MNPAPPTRPSLILAVRDADDQSAWSEFVDLYTPLVFGHCRRRGLQEADASDVAQEVLRSVAHAIAKFEYDRSRGTFRAWLLTVTRSKLNNFFKRQTRAPVGTGDTEVHRWLSEQPSKKECDEWELEYRDRLFAWATQRVRGSFQTATWEAFWRTAVLQQSVPEVAAALALSPGAVYIARSRVIARLRDEISTIDQDEDPTAISELQ